MVKIVRVRKKDEGVTTLDLGNKYVEFEGTFTSVEEQGPIETTDFSKTIAQYKGKPVYGTKRQRVLKLTKPDGTIWYKKVDE